MRQLKRLRTGSTPRACHRAAADRTGGASLCGRMAFYRQAYTLKPSPPRRAARALKPVPQALIRTLRARTIDCRLLSPHSQESRHPVLEAGKPSLTISRLFNNAPTISALRMTPLQRWKRDNSCERRSDAGMWPCSAIATASATASKASGKSICLRANALRTART